MTSGRRPSAASHMPRPFLFAGPTQTTVPSYSYSLLFFPHELSQTGFLPLDYPPVALPVSTRPPFEVPRRHGCAYSEFAAMQAHANAATDSFPSPAQSRLDELVLNPNLAPFLAVLKGARNGVVYGSKVRFPHALVYVDYRVFYRNYERYYRRKD